MPLHGQILYWLICEGSPSTGACPQKSILNNRQRDTFKMEVWSRSSSAWSSPVPPHHPQRNRSFQWVGYKALCIWLPANSMTFFCPLASLAFCCSLNAQLGSHLMSFTTWALCLDVLPPSILMFTPHLFHLLKRFSKCHSLCEVFSEHPLRNRNPPLTFLPSLFIFTTSLLPSHLLIYPLLPSFVCLLFSPCHQLSALKRKTFFSLCSLLILVLRVVLPS